MAPSLSEEEIDDLIYLARAGEDAELTEMLQELATREAATPADILIAAREDQSKATCLHMAAANGHASKFLQLQAQPHTSPSSSPWRWAIGVARHTSTVRCRVAKPSTKSDCTTQSSSLRFERLPYLQTGSGTVFLPANYIAGFYLLDPAEGTAANCSTPI